MSDKDMTSDAKARSAALEILDNTNHTPAPIVVYESGGHLLVCSSEPLDSALANRILGTGLKSTFLVRRDDLTHAALGEGPGNSDLIEGSISALEGHLGDFRVALRNGDQTIDAGALSDPGGRSFDIVLDFSNGGFVSQDLPPVGYYAPDSEQALNAVLAEIPEMVGEFEKPRYFRLDPDACAHTSRGVVACTRCLDACPTLAITPGQDSVLVDSYACQGIGICTTLCPTGAISYAYPRVSDLLDDLRRILHRYHDGNGRQPALLFHDDERGSEFVQQIYSGLPGNLIPVEVESVASVGMDVWLSSLAYGAHRVFLLRTDAELSGTGEAIENEIKVTQAILDAMGYTGDRITVLSAGSADEIPELLPDDFGEQLVTPAGFAGFDEKRTTIRLALDHFLEHAPEPANSTLLPHGAAFGRVLVNRDDCTLCMSCVAVCPTAALQSGGGIPRLMFAERNCVQCGMCDKACPEDAIQLEARFNPDACESGDARVVNEEEPFNCVSCGKPFSTQKMMARIREKLADHWMYQEEAQVRRLEMCENCRVEDLYLAGGGQDPRPDRGQSGGPGEG